MKSDGMSEGCFVLLGSTTWRSPLGHKGSLEEYGRGLAGGMKGAVSSASLLHQ